MLDGAVPIGPAGVLIAPDRRLKKGKSKLAIDRVADIRAIERDGGDTAMLRKKDGFGHVPSASQLAIGIGLAQTGLPPLTSWVNAQ